MRTEVPSPRRWQILAVLCLSLLVVGLDNLIVQVALPTMQRELTVTPAELQWIVDSYILAMAGLLLFAGGLADRLGAKRVLLTGFALFLAASVGAAASTDAATLIGWRAAMGVGAAAIMPATLAIIRQVFPARERSRAIGIWAGAAAFGIPLGPVVGGLILRHFDWSAIFLVNVPLVLVAFAGAALLVPALPRASRARLDAAGAALSTAGLTAAVWAVIETPERGLADGLVLGAFAAAALLLAAFAWWERRAPHPLLPPSLARDRYFAVPFAAIVVLALALFGAVFVLTQYLQYVRGHDPLAAGLRLLAIATVAVGAPAGAALGARLGLRRVLPVGLLLIAAALVTASRADVSSEAPALAGLALAGLGIGLTMTSASDTILTTTPPEKAGVGSAATDNALQLGGAVGVALLGSVLNSAYADEFGAGAARLPEPARAVAEDSVGGAVQVADRLGGDPSAFLSAAYDAFLAAQTQTLLLGAALAAAGAVLLTVLLPHGRPAERGNPQPGPAPQEADTRR